MESAKAGKVRLWGRRISKDVRSNGRCVYDCQATCVKLTILGGLGINESDVQTKEEKSKSKSEFDHHPNGRRDEREMIPGFPVSAVETGSASQRSLYAAAARWVARSTSDPGLGLLLTLLLKRSIGVPEK